MAKTPIQTQNIDQGLDERLDSVVESSYIDVPFTTITNRSKIRDFSNDLRVISPVERLYFGTDYEEVEDETFSIGKVWKPKKDLLDRVRVFGDVDFVSGSTGNYVRIDLGVDEDGSALETVFYGTGLNLLVFALSATEIINVYVDGALQTSALDIGSESAVLAVRNYNTNSLVNVVSGLTPGLHTVRIEVDSTSVGSLHIYGLEFLNETATLNTNPGAAYKGADKRTSLANSQSYNSGFEIQEGTPGTKGGHVSVYQDSEGSIKKAIRWTETSQLNLASADHSNEELIKRLNPIEFGKGRTDDFSTLENTIRDAAFTLDDGTTTLVGEDVRNITWDNLLQGGAADFYTLTFVGTGLDVISLNAYTDAEIIIDGISVGTLTPGGVNLTPKTVPIVSGLPYGTHTVSFVRNPGFIGVEYFLVYGPKKPTLPADAVELGDYFLMADFVANTTPGVNTISTGVLRKDSTRELIYVDGTGGTADWNLGSLTSTRIGGWQAQTDRLNAYMQYTFYGTGFDLRWVTGSNRSSDISVTLDGTALTAANFPTATFSTYGTGISYNTGTGSLDQQDAAGEEAGFVVSGLPLGLYTVKFNNNVASSFLLMDAIDIITPIHTPSFDTEIEKQQIIGASGGGVRDQRKLVGKATLKTRKQQIEDGEIQFTHDFSGAKLNSVSPGFAVTQGRFIPYKTANGVWRLMISYDCTHTAAISADVNIAGVEFRDLSSWNQALAAVSGAGSNNARAFTINGTGDIDHSFSANSNALIAAGDVELENKPTWAV